MTIRAAQANLSEALKELAADMPEGTARLVRADEGMSVWVKSGGKFKEYPVVETVDVRTTIPVTGP